MIFTAGNFSFHSICPGNLELVRAWRNSDNVKSRMIFREEITAEQQQKWYLSINNTEHLYFVAHFRNEAFAVMNFKEINWDMSEAEAGIFVGNPKYLCTETPALGALLLTYFAFNALGFIRLKSRTLEDNKTVSAYNRALGYTLLSSEGPSVHWTLLREDFNKNTSKLMTAVKVLSDFQGRWTMEMDSNDVQTGLYDLLGKRLTMNNIPFSCRQETSLWYYDIQLDI